MPVCTLRPLAAALAAALACGAQAQTGDDRRSMDPINVRGTPPAETLSLDDPTATGSRLGLTPRETPAAVTVIDRATIDLRGAIDTQDILRGVPGVTASSPPGSAGSIFWRGFSTTNITQLFNGISVQYDAIAARPVDSWIYDRVEAIAGPSSFLFGAGAVGGSVNYVTKLPVRDARFVHARASGGNYDTTQLSAGVNAALGSTGAVAHTGRLDVNRSASLGWVDGQEREAWQLAASALSDLGPRLSHTLAYEYQHEKVDRPYWGTPLLVPTTGEGRIDPRTRFENYNSIDGIYEQTVQWARSILEWRPAPATAVRNTAYLYDALRDYRNVEVYRYNATNTLVDRSAALLQRHDQRLIGDRVEVTHRTRFGTIESDWAAGLDYSVNKQTRFPRSLSAVVSSVDPVDFTTENFFSVPGMVPGFDPDRSHRLETLALFAENRTRLLSNVALVTALRHDRIDLDVVNHRTASASDPASWSRDWQPTTGRAGVVWDVARTLSVYAQYATAADPPAGILTTATFTQVRDFDLTTGRQVEAGGKWILPDGRGAMTLAAYRIERKNLAISDPSNPGTTVPVGKQSSRGIELAASFRPVRPLLLQGDFSWVDAQFDDFTENVAGVAVSRAGNRPPNVPARVGNLWLAWDATSALQVGADVRYVSSRFGNAANTVSDDAYTLLGGYATWKLARNAALTARVRNATDEVYAASVTGAPMFYLGAPRTWEIELRASF